MYFEMYKIIITFLLIIFLPCSSFASAFKKPSQITIYIPGNKGGAYHHTAMQISRFLTKKYDIDVRFQFVVGAGGVLALNQFLNVADPNSSILLGGKSMMGAAIYNNSSESITRALPLARLLEKPLALAVPIDSPIKTQQDFFNLLELEPEAIKWVGGSAGAADYQFIQRLYIKLGLTNNQLNYFSVPGGGNQVATELIETGYTVAISSIDEFNDALNAKKLRILGLSFINSSNAHLPLLDKRYTEGEFVDWHGVFLSPNINPEIKTQFTHLFATLVADANWQQALIDNMWLTRYLESDPFTQFVTEQQHYVKSQFDKMKKVSLMYTDADEQLRSVMAKPYRSAIYIGLVCILLCIFILVLRFNGSERERALNERLSQANQQKREAEQELAERVHGVSGHINDEFTKWQLTKAEKEVGLLLLKGLTFKEIAEVRSKSERTVRQQAGAIYAKSSLANRNDLAAYFLEDLM